MSRQGLNKGLSSLSEWERAQHDLEMVRSREVMKKKPVALGGGDKVTSATAAVASPAVPKRGKSAPAAMTKKDTKKKKKKEGGEAAVVLIDVDKKKKAAATAAKKKKKAAAVVVVKSKKRKVPDHDDDDDDVNASIALLAEGEFPDDGATAAAAAAAAAAGKKKRGKSNKLSSSSSAPPAKKRKTAAAEEAEEVQVIAPPKRPDHVPAIVGATDAVAYAGKADGLTIGGASAVAGQSNFELVSDRQVHIKYSVGSGHYVFLRKKVYYKRSSNTLERFIDVVCENHYNNRNSNRLGVHKHSIPAAIFPEWLESAKVLCDIVKGVAAGDVKVDNTLTPEELDKLTALNLSEMPVNMGQYSSPPPPPKGQQQQQDGSEPRKVGKSALILSF